MYNQKPLLGTLPNYPHPLTPNVAAWIMNEGSGNKIFDLSGKGNHGNITGAEWKPDNLYFSTGDYTNHGEILSVNDWKTIVTKIKIRDITADHSIFSRWNGGGTLGEWLFQFDDVSFKSSNNDVFLFVLDTEAGISGGWPVVETDTISLNTWYSIAFVFDKGNDLRIYLNGADASNNKYNVTNTTSTIPTGVNFHLGQSYDGTKDGNQLQEYLYIYDKILTDSEIKQLHSDPYCWLAQPMGAELMYAAPPVGLSIPVAMHHYEALRAC